jgi:cytochrome c2
MQQTREPLAPQGVGGVGGLRWSSDGSYISERHDWIGAVCIVYVMLPVSSSVPQERDVASGQLVFNNVCRTCHTTREGDNRLGPNLYKIVGRKAGSLQNYGHASAIS